MRRFVMLSVLLLFAVPFGVSISGCSKSEPVVFCNGGDSGPSTGQVTSIFLGPIASGVSLNYAEISQVNQPSPTDCKGQSASAGAFTYGTTDMTIADVQPSTGRVCGGTWNRNSGGGIPDYTVCNPTNKTGTAYISASAQGVTSNPLPVFVHPVVTSVVFGTNSSSIPTATITAYSITANTPTFTAPNSYVAGQVVSLYGFPTSTFFNGISTAVVQAAGLSASQFTVSILGFAHANTPTINESGYAGPSNCLANATTTTSCYPIASLGSASAPPYDPTSCVSQGQTRQLVAQVFAGTAANPANISRYVGPLVYQAEGSTGGTAVSPVVSIDPNGVATANQPGSVLISAYISNAASSAGLFSTCPPASISLSVPGTTGNGPYVIDPNNTEPLVATAVDTLGKPITGLTLEYESTTPTTVSTVLAAVTPLLAGAASITAICQPPACNSSAYNQIGLFGNGKPVTSNSVNVVAPGTNSTVLYMASSQSKYITSRDFTQPSLSTALLLPYTPNSMVINTSGTTIYMGSTTALMVLSAGSSLSVSRVDPTSEGTVLAISPDSSQIVISDPIKQIITIENTAGGVLTTYGGVATRAQYTPDSQTVYIAAGNQVLVYSALSGWTSISPATNAGNPVTDVAVTVPAVGAYFAGLTTTARDYCSISTPGTPGNETNVFYPIADNSSAITDRIAATNDGKHILGATVNPAPTLNDLEVQVPVIPGPGGSVACPLNGTLTFSNSVVPIPLAGVTASAITGVFPTSDSSEAFITYTGSGGVLPAYAPTASGPGTYKAIQLNTVPGSVAPIAPLAGTVTADNTTFYVGTSGDNLVHSINRSTLTDMPALALAPNLTNPSGATVPVDLLVQKPRTAN